MSCIFRNPLNPEIESKLHKKLVEIMPSQEAADKMLAYIYTPSFKEKFGIDFEQDWKDRENNTNQLIEGVHIDETGEPLIHTNEFGRHYIQTMDGKFHIDVPLLNIPAEARDAIVNMGMFQVLYPVLQQNKDITDGLVDSLRSLKKPGNMVYNYLNGNQVEIDAVIRILMNNLGNMGIKFTQDHAELQQQITENIDDLVQDAEVAESNKMIDLVSSAERNSKDNASVEIKTLFSMIPVMEKVDGELRPKVHTVNISENETFKYFKFYSADEMWRHFEEELSNTPDIFTGDVVELGMFDRMLQKMSTKYPDNHSIQHVINIVRDKMPEYKQTMFVQAFSKANNNFQSTLIKPDDTVVVINSADFTNRESKLTKEWNNSLITSKLFKYVNGNYVYDTELAKSINQNYKDLYNKTLDKNYTFQQGDFYTLQKLLQSVGIGMSLQGLSSYIAGQKQDTNTAKFRSGVDKLRFLFDTIAKATNSTALNVEGAPTNILTKYYAPELKMGASNIVKDLAKIEAEYAKDLSENTVLGPEGKKYWTYSLPSYISNKIDRLKQSRETELQPNIGFYTNSLWIKYLNDADATTLEKIALASFSNFRIEGTQDEGASNKTIEKSDQTIDQINKTLYGRKGDNSESQFYTPIPADKSTLYSLKGFPLQEVFIDSEGNLNEGTIDIFMDYLFDEYERMGQEIDLISNPEANKDKLYKDYHYHEKGGKIYYWGKLKSNGKFDYTETNEPGTIPVGNAFRSGLFPALSPYYLDSKTKQINTDSQTGEAKFFRNGRVIASYSDMKSNTGLRNYVRDTLLDVIVKTEIELTDIGVIDSEGKILGVDKDIKKYYLSKLTDPVAAKKSLIADFAINSMIANIEYSKVFSGDYAFYKNLVDLSKRYPATYTDGNPIALREGDPAFYTVAVLPNVIKPSTILAELESTNKDLANAYKDNNLTDAQGWITLDRWKFIMERSNHWGPKYEEAYNRIVDGTATYEHYKYAAQPIKGVFFGHSQDGVPTYIKYSAAVLIPSGIKGTKLAELARDMEAQGIDEAVVIDGIKVGAKLPSNVLDSYGNYIGANSLNTINVYWGQAESETSTRMLSNLAPRKFIYEGREYGSVEHAYQSLKSGTFDEVTYNKYNQIGGYGQKIRGKGTIAEMKTADSLGLMKKLVVESFKQNPNSEATQKLLQYENFTHNTNQLIDQAFLEGLKLAQKELGGVKGNIFSKIKLRNNEYKIQQDLRPKGVKPTLIGSQIKKTLFANHNMTLDYGDGWDGQRVWDTFVEIHNALSNKGVERLKEEAGIDADGNIINKNKLTKKIVDTLKERNAPDNLIDALEKEYSYDVVANYRQKIQNVLASVINNASVNLKSNGASYIQMSSWAIDQNTAEESGVRWLIDEKTQLKAPRIIDTEDGKRKLLPGQVFVTSEYISRFIPNWKQLYDKNPKEFLKLIDSEAFNIIGYRIPNQGMSSNDSLQIVGILDEGFGDTIVPYGDITKKTGSDFDIDKMYVMIPNVRAVFNEKSFKTAKEFLRSRFKGKTIEDTTNNLLELLDEHKISQTPEDFVNSIILKTNIELLSDSEKDVIQSIVFDSNTKLGQEYIKEYGIGELKKLEYIKYDYNKPASEQSQKALENGLMEMFRKKLENVENYEALMNPIDSEDLKNDVNNLHDTDIDSEDLKNDVNNLHDTEETPVVESSEETEYINNDLGVEFFGPMYQLNKKFDNSIGKSGVGLTANQLVDHTFTQIANVYSDKLIALGIKNEDGTTSFAGVKDMLSENNITDVISWFLNAYVDIAKDPYVGKGNHNEITSNTAFMLIRAGVPWKLVNRIVGQPSVKILVDVTRARKAKISGWDNRSIRDAVIEKLAEINDVSMDIVRSKGFKDSLPNVEKELRKIDKMSDSDRKDFIKTMQDRAEQNIKSTEKSLSKLKKDIFYLDLYQHFQSIGEDFAKTVLASKQDVNGMGKDSISAQVNKNRVEEAMNLGFYNVDKKFSMTFLGTSYENSVELGMKVFENSFVTSNKAAQKIYDMVYGIYDNSNNPLLNEEFGFELEKAYFAHLLGQTGFDRNKNEVRDLFFGENTIFDRMYRIKEMYPDNDNVLLNSLTGNLKKKGRYVTLENTRNRSTAAVNDIVKAWKEMLNSKNDTLRNFAKDLITYTYYSSGFKTNMGSFFEYIPHQELKILVEDGIANAKNIFSNEGVAAAHFADKFFRHNWNNDKIVPNIKSNEKGMYPKGVTISKDGYITLSIEPKNKHRYTKPYILFTGRTYNAFGDVVETGSVLYKKYAVNEELEQGYYIPVPKLGTYSQGSYIYEYNKSIEIDGESALDFNNVFTNKKPILERQTMAKAALDKMVAKKLADYPENVKAIIKDTTPPSVDNSNENKNFGKANDEGLINPENCL